MKVIIATNNPHKLKEFSLMLDEPGIEFSLLEYHIPSHIESGKTFYENALKKALFGVEKTKKPVMAEDSGLVVPSLGGEPGIYSSRWKGLKTHEERNEYLLHLLRNKSQEERKAFFICVIAFLFPNKFGFFTEGRVHGIISKTPRGKEGFGYDPVFFYPPYGKTFAELSTTEKNRISHRAVAFKKFLQGLKTLKEWIDYSLEPF